MNTYNSQATILTPGDLEKKKFTFRCHLELGGCGVCFIAPIPDIRYYGEGKNVPVTSCPSCKREHHIEVYRIRWGRIVVKYVGSESVIPTEEKKLDFLCHPGLGGCGCVFYAPQPAIYPDPELKTSSAVCPTCPTCGMNLVVEINDISRVPRIISYVESRKDIF